MGFVPKFDLNPRFFENGKIKTVKEKQTSLRGRRKKVASQFFAGSFRTFLEHHILTTTTNKNF
jgi:hypothetical protein